MFYNQDPRPERFLFEAHCVRVPLGTKVSLECSDSALAYPLSSGEVEITRDYQVVSAEAQVPPNYSGAVHLRYRTPDGGALPRGSAIEVRMKWIVPQSHENYLDAVQELGTLEHYALRQSINVDMGDYTLIGVS